MYMTDYYFTTEHSCLRNVCNDLVLMLQKKDPLLIKSASQLVFGSTESISVFQKLFNNCVKLVFFASFTSAIAAFYLW